VLEGHTGCVNRLAWSADGHYLASGSDDRNIQVWPIPHGGPGRPIRLETHHQGNIFGVAWLANTGNRELVTGAMDFTVQHHMLDRSPASLGAPGGAEPPAVRSTPRRSPVECHSTMYTGHRGRIKAVETAPGDPNQFWSASEDGTVRQFDKRLPVSDQRTYESHTVLIQVAPHGRPTELKSLAINTVQPHQVAVAAGDSTVRIYDRRMLSLIAPQSPGHSSPLLDLTPPHLQPGLYKGRARHATYVRFGNRGDKVVANYNGDHAYSFDVTAAAQGPRAVFRTASLGTIAANVLTEAALDPPRAANLRVPSEAEVARGKAHEAYFQQRPVRAFRDASRALRLAPAEADLYALRAAALKERGWVGDAMYAVRDCERALRLDPSSQLAKITRAHALLDMDQLEAARVATEAVLDGPPEAEESAARLFRDIEDRSAQLKAKWGGSSDEESDSARMSGSPPPSRHRRRHHRHQQHHESQSHSHEQQAAADQRAAPRQPQAPGEAASVAEREGAVSGAEPAGRPPTGASHIRGSQGTPASSDAARQHSGSDLDEGNSDSSGHHSGGSQHSTRQQTSDLGGAPAWQLWEGPGGRRLLQRYVGHCNSVTDIKEAVFLGADDQLVACGSDDGRVFIYDAATGELIMAATADSEVVNCCQGHPHLSLLATSGIESVVRLWAPAESDSEADTEAWTAEDDRDQVVEANQKRMREGTSMLRGVNLRNLQAFQDNPELLAALMQQAGGGEEGDGALGDSPQIHCRVS